jgi:hypothetical protein
MEKNKIIYVGDRFSKREATGISNQTQAGLGLTMEGSSTEDSILAAKRGDIAKTLENIRRLMSEITRSAEAARMAGGRHERDQ